MIYDKDSHPTNSYTMLAILLFRQLPEQKS